MDRSASDRDFYLEPYDPFFEAIRGMVEREIHPEHSVTFVSQVDLTEIEAVRKRSAAARPSYTAFVVKAVAQALKRFPYSNRRCCRGLWPIIIAPRLQAFNNCDVAVNVERDLANAASATFADILRNADQLSLEEIRSWLSNLANSDLESNKQWRDFYRIITRLPRQLSNLLLRLPYFFPNLWVKYRGAAAIVSVPSKYGVHGLVGTWTSPIGVSFGLVRQIPRVVNSQVEVVPAFSLVLNFDRRVMAGAQAARFFNHIVNLLENAETALVDAKNATLTSHSTLIGDSNVADLTSSVPFEKTWNSTHSDTRTDMAERRHSPDYKIEPNNRFFQAIYRMNRYEHRPGNTVTFASEVDLTNVQKLRESLKANKPSYTAIVAKAVAKALREFPYANRRVCRRIWLPFAAPRLQTFEHVDIAVAVERNVPGAESAAFIDVMRDADEISLTDATNWLTELGTSDMDTNKQWRSFSFIVTKLPPLLAAQILRLPYYFPQLWVKYRGGAVLISSPAKYGVDSVVATWSWPLGISFGLVKPRPIVRDGKVDVRPTFQFTLNFDRRVMAGAQAARFFKRVVDILEDPMVELSSVSEQPTNVSN